MNLYALKFRHHSQKDYKEGIVTYLAADSDGSVYEWIKSDPKIRDQYITTSYADNEYDGKTFNIYDDKYDVVGTETFKDRMIRLRGEMFDEEAEVCDTYYGVTHYGWELVKENISRENFVYMQNMGIDIVEVGN